MRIKLLFYLLTSLLFCSFSLGAQYLGDGPKGGPIVKTDDGNGDIIIVAAPGDWDHDDWTVINCKYYPKLCDDIDPGKDEPGKTEPDEPGKDKKKKKKKKKDRAQAYSYHELPGHVQSMLEDFQASGLKIGWTRLSEGKWFEIKDPDTFMAKRLNE
jgi:hypothetical protein